MHEGSETSELICMGNHANKAHSAELQASVQLLGEMGLTCDSWLYHSNIDDLAVLARSCQDTTIICDHVGMPLGVGP